MFVLILVCVLVCASVLWMRRKPRVKSPPMYSGALPIIGHAHKMLGNDEYFHRRVKSLAKECNEKGGVMLLKIGFADYYLITDPDDFTTAANQCLRAHFTHEYLQPWLGDGLVSGTDIAVWKRHRKLMSPAFSQHVFEGFISTFNDVSKKIVGEMSEKVGKGPFDHAPYWNRVALEVICQTSFGVTVEQVDNFNIDTFMKTVTKFFHFVRKRIQNWWLHSDLLYSFSTQKRNMDKVSNYLNGISKKVIAIKKKKLLAGDDYNGTKPKLFMDLALELSSKGEFTDEEVYQEMNTIIAAAYETTGSSLMFIVLLLGSYIEVQNKVYEELQSVFGDSTRDVVKQDLSKLVYLEAVLKEALRFYTLTPAMLRSVDSDVKLKHYTMPAGSNCVLFICGLHRHPSWGPDVEVFRPERWLGASSDPDAITNKGFVGFGVGKRLCLGKPFAIMSLKTSLVHLLRKYHVTSDVTNLVLKLDPLLKPVSGHEISLHLRSVPKDRQVGA